MVAVYLTYAGPRGHAFIDRALYLPKSWTSDPDRCATAGVPDDVEFATKPALAAQRPPAPSRPRCRPPGSPGTRSTAPTRDCGPPSAAMAWAMCCRSRPTVASPPPPDPIRVDQLPGPLPSWAWQRRSAGAGSKAHRYYSWAWIELLPQGTGDTGDEQGQHSVGFRTRVPRALIVALFRWRTGTTLPSTA
jgi:hypothetical protein